MLWEKVAFRVMKRPVFLVLLISGLLILLMLPIGNIKLAVPSAEVLPPSYESRAGSDLLKQTYDPREANPIQIVVTTPGMAGDQPAIGNIRQYLSKVRGVSGVRHAGQALSQGHTALIAVVPASDPDSAETTSLIRKLRRLDSGGLGTYVTGTAANRVDILDRINSGMPEMVGFVMAITYLVLFIAFRSVLLPLKAVMMNVLSLGASLGIVVIVFQKGIMAAPLHVTSVGYVSIVLPVTIFCVVFGISMDYEVFLISRIKEEYERTGDNEWSTAVGLQKTGGLITSAALILIVVVGSFIFTDIEITKALGVGLFSAIFIDATCIRVIVVPALMKLLGRANWWAPAFGR